MTRTALLGLAILAAFVALYPSPAASKPVSQPDGNPSVIPAAENVQDGTALGVASGTIAGTQAPTPRPTVLGTRGAAESPLSRRTRGEAVRDPRHNVTVASRASRKPHSAPRPLSAAARAVGTFQVAVRATFYCVPGRSRCTRGYPASGMYAAISPDLRAWTGRLVKVCTPSDCVTVRIVDCDCQAEHSIDLFGAAFQRLAPLSVGVLTVTLEVQ